MRTGNRLLTLTILGLLALTGLRPEPVQAAPKCTCAQGNACWHYLRASSPPPEDPCSCDFCERLTRHDGTRPWPKGWNGHCGGNGGTEGFLRRHAATWNLSCSERNKNWRGSCKHPDKHPFCGSHPRDWNREGQEMIARMVGVEREVLGFKPVIVQSPHFYLVTDIPSLKIRTQKGNFRIVRTHELAHIYIERCEKAYEEFTRVIGRPTLGRPAGVFLFKSKSVAEMVQQRYLGSPRTNLLYGGGGTSISKGHCFNGFCVNLQEHSGDRNLHATVRHQIGHLLISCWVVVNGTDRHLPRWMFIGCAHWLCKSHPKLKDEVTFCGNESTPLTASGRNWDDKARKLAAGQRAPVQQMFDANTTQEMNRFDMHLRAWSYFEVLLEDDRERFVKFLSGLRKTKPAREALRTAMKSEPEELDRRWADRLLGRRRSAAPTVAELDDVDPSAPGARDRHAIRNAVETKRLAALVRGLNEIRDVRTARTVLPLLGHESTHVRETAVITLGKTRDKKVLAKLREDGLQMKGLALANAIRVLGLCRDKEALQPVLALLEHASWLVRANACRTLGQLGDAKAIDPLALRVSRDASPKVNISAMRALATFEEAAGRTARMVSGEVGASSWQVRVAACKTLAKLGDMSAVEDLIIRMENEAGRVREECYEALKQITRDDLGRKPKFWRDWWEKEKARARGIPARPKAPPSKSGVEGGRETVVRKKDEPTYYGIKVFSQSVGYVLDISQSMDSRFVISQAMEKRLGRTFQAHTKIGIAKEELIHAIQALDPRATFNVILFNSGVRSWKGSPVPANESNKGRAISTVRNARPDKETNYYDTFLEVFGVKADEPPGPRFRRTPDTVFFLTDGQPTVGELTETEELLSWFREQNRFAQLRCHVIAFGDKGIDIHFLTTLATENSGKFFHLRGE